MADTVSGTEGEPGSNLGGQPAGGDSGGGGEPGNNQGGSLLGGAPEPQDGQGTTSGGDGGQPAGSQSPLLDMIGDEDLKADQSLQQVQSVEDLAKGYVHAQKLVGKDKLVLPKDENDTDAWNDVFKKLGRPNDPSEYELPSLDENSKAQVPEGTDEWFKNKAHELGLTNKQARDLWSSYLTDVAEKTAESAEQQAQQAREQAEAQLKQEFGKAFDEKLNDARVALKQYDTDGSVTQALDQSGLGNDPAVIKMLSQIGEQFREDKVGGSSKQFSRTPEQAQQEIRDLKLDQSFQQAWMNPQAPGHQAAVEKLQALYEEAYPNG